ncbi:MAG: type II toxin-antitoxin system VapC family toxin [Acidimicrobiales bacterium]
MTVVVDASVVVAALIDRGADGKWAERILGSDALVAPHLMPVEVANVLRRALLARDISVDSASLAHADLIKLRIDLFAYEPFAERAWALRNTMSAYDAWYVALAESLDAPVATLDSRLARSAGARCRFIVPGSSPASGQRDRE